MTWAHKINNYQNSNMCSQTLCRQLSLTDCPLQDFSNQVLYWKAYRDACKKAGAEKLGNT